METRRNKKVLIDTDFIYEGLRTNKVASKMSTPKLDSSKSKSSKSRIVAQASQQLSTTGQGSELPTGLPPISPKQVAVGMDQVSSMLALLEARIKELEFSNSSKPKAKSELLTNKMDISRNPMISNQLQLEEDENQAQSVDLPTTSGSTSHGKTSTKSGYDISCQAEVVNKVLWPHGFVSKLQQYTDIKPDNISMEAFFYGFFAILLQINDDKEKKGRLHHAKQVLWHSLHHGWTSARNFHYQVLRDIEIGSISWDDLQEMQVLALAAAEGTFRTGYQKISLTPGTAEKQDDDAAVVKQPTMCCFLYNNDENGCKFEREAGHCKKLHACSSCAKKGYFHQHRAAFDCKK